jgi:hypothetical protein
MVLRLVETHKNPVLRFVNASANKTVINNNLLELIFAANTMGASIDFNKTHEFDIKYELDPTAPMQLIVYINGWKLVMQSEGL